MVSLVAASEVPVEAVELELELEPEPPQAARLSAMAAAMVNASAFFIMFFLLALV